jgi:hypothetical protein
MKLEQLSFLFILAVPAAVAGAQGTDGPSAEAPKAPEGWQYVTGKDGSYRFLFPTDKRRSGSREQSVKRGGLSVKSQINYCELADGTALLISAEKLSGPALRGMKVGDVYNLVVDGIKEKGYEVSQPKLFPLGKEKGREYFLTGEKLVQRKVLLILRDGRAFDLTVVAGDKDKLRGPPADTFLKSLTLIAKTPAKPGGGN